MDADKEKSRLRTRCLDIRNSMSAADRNERSSKIVKQILQSREYAESEVIHCFVPMVHKNEVNLFPLLETILSSGKHLIVPVTDFDSGCLRHSGITSLETLSPNKWGVPEPDSGSEEPDPAPDLILVPALAADHDGNRLGYGKGYYDRFLASSESPAFGILFSELVVDTVPVDEYDQPLTGFYTQHGQFHTKLKRYSDVDVEK